MNDNERYFEREPEAKISGRFSEDLNALFKPDMSVPPEVDRAIMDRASKHFIRRRQKTIFLRWFTSAAAVAAVIVFIFVLDTTKKPAPVTSGLTVVAAGTDIDRNGCVDILDAFKLARHIESAQKPNAKWDINGDGIVSRKDVDAVAFAAVRLDKGKML